jgi:hypothetical protein
MFLMQLGDLEACVFGDILVGLRGIENITDDMSYLEKHAAFRRSFLAPSAWCYKHQKYCFVRGGLADFTGLPCTDWSSSGNQLGLEGRTMKVWIAHFRKHSLLRTPILLLENTRRCPTSVVQSNLPEHTVQRIEVDPSDVGWGLVNRPRSYFLCTHKGLVQIKMPWADVYRAVVSGFDHVSSRPRNALLASDDEIEEEALWYAELRRRPWDGNWDTLLLDRERSSLWEYDRLHRLRTADPQTFDDVWNLLRYNLPGDSEENTRN